MKIICLIIPLLMFGCATKISQSGLYWGEYSKTLYEYKKNPSNENLAKHKNELIKIITKSKELKLRPPPGIQAELGMIYGNEQDEKAALIYFSGESETYPESNMLMTKIKDSLKNKKELK